MCSCVPYVEFIIPLSSFCFREQVHWKKRTVKQELSNNTWIKALRSKITSATHVEEFFSLWIHFHAFAAKGLR